MAIRKGVCPVCGAAQHVDTSLRAALCTSCRAPYVVADALPSNYGDPADFLRRGKAYLKIGATARANECFMEGLALDPTNDELKIFYNGFRYFDAEEYIKRHPVMDPCEMEYLYLTTGESERLEYFLRFFDGSVYKRSTGSSYKSVFVRRSTHIIDPYRCDMFCKINNGLPPVSIYVKDGERGLRSPEQIEYLFSRDTAKKFGRVLYAKRHYEAQSKTIFVPKKTIFGNYTEEQRRVKFPEVTVSQYDVIAGNCDLRDRARMSFYGEEIPFEFQVAPNAAVAELIRRYYPR